MKPRLLLGLMSGTSVDAIDVALVRVVGPLTPSALRRGSGVHYRAATMHHHTHAWPAKIRARLLAAMAPAKISTQEICQLNALVSREFARAAINALQRAGVMKSKITAIASHGQTICHLPPASRPKSQNPFPSTLQLGDPSIIATLTGMTTVGNFRTADMALGGQGAPLVPWTDAMLLAHETRTRAVQNIGGIANVTYLPGRSAHSLVIAFDTGPGNMLLDATMSMATKGKLTFDRHGRLAAQGSLNLPLFRHAQRHAYFDRRPPKSTGREEFGAIYAQSLLADRLHTLTRLTTWSIADAYLNYLSELPEDLILCGGGAYNKTLCRMLAEEFGTASPNIQVIDDFGIPNKAKEATSFALLGAATLDGVPANLPSVTGASRPTVLGVIARPGGDAPARRHPD